MKKSLYLFTALASLAPIGAFAADLAPAPRMAAAPAMVAYNPWGGFYGGFSVGWNWGDGTTVYAPSTGAGPVFNAAQTQFNSRAAACALAFNCTATDSSFGPVNFIGREDEKGGAVITVNAGYNWQFGSFVLGVETDLSAMNRRYEGAFPTGAVISDYQFDYASAGGGEFPPPAVRYNGTYTLNSDFATRSRMNWLTTARLRAGFAFGDFLLYATGGLAAGRGSMSAGGTVTESFVETTRTGTIVTPTVLGAPTTSYSVSSTTTWRGTTGGGTDFGWAIGGGMEWMTGRGFSLKAEYLYYDLGDQTLLATGTTTTTSTVPTAAPTTVAAPTIRIRQNLDGHIFRVGLNFGFPVAQRAAAPVVAAY